MVETWVLWLFLVGLATGVVIALVLVVRLPRDDADVSEAERPTEANWIATVIERNGGVAPVLLVEEILDLHQAYLNVARPPVPPSWSDGQVPWAGPYPAVTPNGPMRPPVPPPPGTLGPGFAPGRMPAAEVPGGPVGPPGSVPAGAVPPPVTPPRRR